MKLKELLNEMALDSPDIIREELMKLISTENKMITEKQKKDHMYNLSELLKALKSPALQSTKEYKEGLNLYNKFAKEVDEPNFGSSSIKKGW